MTKFFLRFKALDDPQEFYDYSEQKWGESTAPKYLLAFEDTFTLLQENPGLLRINRQVSSRFTIYNVRNH